MYMGRFGQSPCGKYLRALPGRNGSSQGAMASPPPPAPDGAGCQDTTFISNAPHQPINGRFCIEWVVWCSVRPAAVLLASLLVLLLGASTLGAAETAGTTATVRNGVPQITDHDILFDARLGIFHYEVRATDPNGAPDLDRLVFHFLDADGRLWTHRDTEHDEDGTEGLWRGIAHVGVALYRGPFEVHLHVYDVHDADAEAEAPVTILSGPLETVRETRSDLQDIPEQAATGPEDQRFLPLIDRVSQQPLPSPTLLIGIAAAAGATVLLAVGIRARPAAQDEETRPVAQVRLIQGGTHLRTGRRPDGPLPGARSRGGPRRSVGAPRRGAAFGGAPDGGARGAPGAARRGGPPERRPAGGGPRGAPGGPRR